MPTNNLALMSSKLWMTLYELQCQRHSPAKVAALEVFVRDCDASGDKRMSVVARLELIHAAVSGGAHDKALVAFAWCLAQYDNDHDSCDLHELLWKYKWILAGVTEFPTILCDRIHSLQEDFENRLKSNGYSVRPILKLRMEAARKMGQLEEAARWYEDWKKSPRDSMADCKACDLDEEVAALAAFGKHQEAAQKADSLIHGNERCAEVPHLTYGRAILPLVHLERFDNIKTYFTIGYPMVSRNPDFLRTFSQHLVGLTAIGDFSRGIRLIEKHLPWAIATSELLAKMEFLHAAALLLERLATVRPKPRKLKLPTSLTCFRTNSAYAPGELAQYFQIEAGRLAKDFDQRNGNTYYTTTFASDRTLVGIDGDHSLRQ